MVCWWVVRSLGLVYPGVREARVVGGGEWGLETAERGGDEFSKWCQAASARWCSGCWVRRKE